MSDNAPLRSDLKSSPSIDGANDVDSGARARVGLTIVADSDHENLARCLESVRDIFDEIIVADTGCSDRTEEIARSFGAKRISVACPDDLASALNEALARATGDYAFYLDSHDVIEPAERDNLVVILRDPRAGEQAAFVTHRVYNEGPFSGSAGVAGREVVDRVHAVSHSPRCALDGSHPRADLAGVAAGEGSDSLD
jgi:cellulose synthase/poly-beta-1,6-N-acetylglucosamine synthase-like glycosyltransferase